MLNTLPEKQYLTPKEVAFCLGRDVKTVYGWIYQGRVDSIKVVGSVYIVRDSVVSLVVDPDADYSVKVF